MTTFFVSRHPGAHGWARQQGITFDQHPGGFSVAAGKTELTWFGQSTFRITTPNGKVLLIDPWIVNPVNKNCTDAGDEGRGNLELLTGGTINLAPSTVKRRATVNHA